MLKRNWNWINNRLFCHWWNFNWGETLPPSPCLRLCSKWGKQKRCSQIFREVSGVFQRNFICSKNSALFESRTWQFLRTWGFEAKAKDLGFWSQGQGQELQNVSTRTSSRPRTSSRTPPLVLIKVNHCFLQQVVFQMRVRLLCFDGRVQI